MEDIVDKCIVYDKTKMFHNPVQKKYAPDYYDLVKDPIDLGTIKNKTKRAEYHSSEGLIADLTKMTLNSELFNGKINFISKLAKSIEEYAAHLLKEYRYIYIYIYENII